jgi:protein involved in polysaccharide export with SLBB domain
MLNILLEHVRQSSACNQRALRVPALRAIKCLFIGMALAVSLPAQSSLSGYGQSSSQGGNNPLSGGYTDGTQFPSSSDCSDPLLAGTAQCSGIMRGESPFSTGQSSSGLGLSGLPGGFGSTTRNAAGNYYDLEPWSQQNAFQSQMRQAPLPPEPLTEFQKFVASTTGQILPIYGAGLFRNVPSTFSPLNMAPVPPDYVIGPGDELRIRLWGQVNTQSNVRVDRSGDIYLPQIGPVHVAGLPFSALQDHLRDAIKPVYRNFDLTVDLGQIRSIQVYVTGQARRPGMYTVSSLSTLVDALFMTGGPSVEGSLRHIELRRASAVVTEFDLYDLLIRGDKSKDVKLLDGDVIYIPSVGPQVALTGSVRNPSIYELRNGESLGTLLTEAGGASAVAAQARVSIERIDDHRDRHAMEVAFDASGLALPLADGDLIRVLSIVPVYRRTVILRGNTANPGRFAWHPGMKISELIPDKESLLTRNYWWKRAQLGLPAPEFEPMGGFAGLRQPAEDRPSSLELSPQQVQNTMNAAGAQGNQAALLQGQMAPGQSQQGSQAQAASLAAQLGAAQNNPPLSAEQRAGSASLASAQAEPASRAVSPEQKNRVQILAPEVDWSYAVIERVDSETLKTSLIPFDLGKLVLLHDASQDLDLQPGDVVTVFSEADIRVPVEQQTKLVTLEGEFLHSGMYTVGPGETLRQLVERAGGLTSKADLYGSEFTRESTRATQQARIDEYVQSLNLEIQRSTLALEAAPGASPADMASGAAAAGGERSLLATLKQIRATGRVVLEFKPDSVGTTSIPAIALEDGDRFVVPPVPATVNVVGAVYDQNSFLYASGRRVGDYVHLAGGPNKNADRKHEFVIRADGEVVSHDMTRGAWGNEFYELRMNPGDTVVIPEKTLKPSVLRGVLDWSQLFSQFALGAAALSVIH